MDRIEDHEPEHAQSRNDFEALINMDVFEDLSEEAKARLLNVVQPVRFSEGDRIIFQGNQGDCFYIVQSGHCEVLVEKNDSLYPCAMLGPGDLVGEMAILTGENRNAHVDARTDMELWRIGRTDVEDIFDECPDVRHLLTQVVTTRFAASDLIADRTIGKYVINEIIGRGGWSIVYKGLHTSLNMPVAIKMLKHDMAMDPTFLQGFQNEASTIASLNHENIVKVYDIEQLFRTVFIIMEHLEGASLHAVVRDDGPLPPARALHILLQACYGLEFAHDSGIIHGDVKPGNIFVQTDDRVKIVDFGLSVPTGTKAARLLGTPYYFAPEKIRMGAVDARSDIYSLGIVVFKMLTGQEPFHAEEMKDLLQMHLYQEITNPRWIVPDLPQELADFVVRATEKDPVERYQNMGQIIHELKPLSQKLGIEVASGRMSNTNMKSLYLFYRDEHQEMVDRLVSDFSREVNKIGTVLREADIKKV
ncbi:protein kinase [Thermodesulfobacteriota bacterium]